jgi:hypothetical protein
LFSYSVVELSCSAVPFFELFSCSAVDLLSCSATQLFSCSVVQLFSCSVVQLFSYSVQQQAERTKYGAPAICAHLPPPTLQPINPSCTDPLYFSSLQLATLLASTRCALYTTTHVGTAAAHNQLTHDLPIYNLAL